VTRLQRLLDVLGLWRFRFYRRWVGGRWAESYVEATPHSTELPYWRWVLDPRATFDDATHAIEQWSTKLLPEAKGRYRK
jgi:hypothetical protein